MHNNPFAIDLVSAFIKDIQKVVSVGAVHVDKVHFAIEPERFGALLIQSLLSRLGLFKHDQRGARDDVITIHERTASGKPIDEI